MRLDPRSLVLIAGRELWGLLRAPALWVILALSEGVVAWVFLQTLERFTALDAPRRVAGLTLELTLNVFGIAAVALLFAVPVLGIKGLSEEFRSGAWRLWGSAPVTPLAVLLGKYLALLVPVATLTALPLGMALTLLPLVALDLGTLGTASLGLFLAGALFAAIGLGVSAHTAQPALAAAGSYAILLALSVVGQAGAVVRSHGEGVFEWLAWNEHFLPFLTGLVRSQDVVYFLLGIGLALLLAKRRLARRIGS
ncbi:MAG: ABC transporter permease [Pseudomonadota bacterium]